MTVAQDPTLLPIGSRELAMGGLVLVLVGLALSPLCVVFARRFAPRAPVFFARWSFQHAILVALCLVVGARVAPALLVRVPGFSELADALAGLVASASSLALCAVAILVVAARRDPDGVASLGLRGPGSLRAAAVGIACYTILLPGLIGLSLTWPWLLELLGGEHEPQAVAEAIGGLHGGAFALAAALAVIVVPCLEELAFRGFLQPLFVQNLGDRGGVFLTSLVFALLHGDAAFLPIFGLAILLGSLQLCTARLSASIAVHALHNALVLAFLAQPE